MKGGWASLVDLEPQSIPPLLQMQRSAGWSRKGIGVLFWKYFGWTLIVTCLDKAWPTCNMGFSCQIYYNEYKDTGRNMFLCWAINTPMHLWPDAIADQVLWCQWVAHTHHTTHVYTTWNIHATQICHRHRSNRAPSIRYLRSARDRYDATKCNAMVFLSVMQQHFRVPCNGIQQKHEFPQLANANGRMCMPVWSRETQNGYLG